MPLGVQTNPSRGGVYTNLRKSSYTYTLYGLVMHFSSKFYHEKFLSKLDEYTEKLQCSMFKLTGITCDCDLLAAIMLYAAIEKRGFFICNALNDDEYKSLSDFTMEASVYNG